MGFRISCVMSLVVMLARMAIFPASFLASAHPTYDCSDETICDAGDDCHPGVQQGKSTVIAKILAGGGYVTTATPVATTSERWVRTTCENISFTAYTTNNEAEALVGTCITLCAANAVYDVWVVDEQGSDGAFCATLTTCQDFNTAGTSATKHNIAISVPNTIIITQNCAYATVYVDTDLDGQWSDNPQQGQDDCADTENKVGSTPL